MKFCISRAHSHQSAQSLPTNLGFLENWSYSIGVREKGSIHDLNDIVYLYNLIKRVAI